MDFFNMKYKLVVKSGNKVWVKAISKSKEHLENRAVSMSKKKPHWKIYVCNVETHV